ncbi:MAG: acyl-CoA thioesterase [Legionellales bacterium]|nr:acyl-CoA thioesterase [Legionellales bacterium]
MPEANEKEKSLPRGELVIRTIAMPRDTNANGDIFGGWLVSQMDVGGAIVATQTAKSRVATVAINQLTFIRPVYVGDIICCYAELIKVGTTSMTVEVQAWSISADEPERKKVTEGTFVFVALDKNRKPKPVYGV